jgi:hypothetical protein
MNTPWGAIQHEQHLESGAAWVATAGHGGLMLTRTYVSDHNLSTDALAVAIETIYHFCFEEDIAWTVPLWELKSLRNKLLDFDGMKDNPEEQEKYLRKTISYWYAGYAIANNMINVNELPDDVFCAGVGGNFCGKGKLTVQISTKSGCVQIVCANCGRLFYGKE